MLRLHIHLYCNFFRASRDLQEPPWTFTDVKGDIKEIRVFKEFKEFFKEEVVGDLEELEERRKGMFKQRLRLGLIVAGLIFGHFILIFLQAFMRNEYADNASTDATSNHNWLQYWIIRSFCLPIIVACWPVNWLICDYVSVGVVVIVAIVDDAAGVID